MKVNRNTQKHSSWFTCLFAQMPCNQLTQWHTDSINISWGWKLGGALYKDKQDLCILSIALETLLHNQCQC